MSSTEVKTLERVWKYHALTCPTGSRNFHSLNYLSLDKYNCIKLTQFHILINYYELTCCIENSVKKPADLDLHCLHLCLYLVSYCFKECMHGISKVRSKLSSLCTICSLGQVKFSFDNYIMTIYLSLGKYKNLLFPHP